MSSARSPDARYALLQHFVMGIAIPVRWTSLKFSASCSRGALLEGAFEAEQDAAPARVSRTHVVREAGVSVRANYVALPSVAGRGQDEGGESRRIGA